MFIILARQDGIPHINIEVDDDGWVKMFDTHKKATQYATENCAWEYKIVKW